MDLKLGFYYRKRACLQSNAQKIAEELIDEVNRGRTTDEETTVGIKWYRKDEVDRRDIETVWSDIYTMLWSSGIYLDYSIRLVRNQVRIYCRMSELSDETVVKERLKLDPDGGNDSDED